MISDRPIDVVVAGHICVDVIPQFTTQSTDFSQLIRPGMLVNVGPALLSTGGAVSNTGLALARLGVPTRLLGKIGDDLFGRAILEVIRRVDPALADDMIVDPAVASSYTIVISAPGYDRSFLHCPGANDAFGADDVQIDRLAGVKVFHLGYPPIMRRLFQAEGAELAELMAKVQSAGVTTSLDMTLPDPTSDAGHAPWPAILARTLPHVDLFLPSLEETVFMLDRPRFEALVAAHDWTTLDGAYVRGLGSQLLALGAAVVGLKLGDQGLYVVTTDDRARLARMGRGRPAEPDNWRGRELLAPCFAVEVAGTTGAGDCTIAGFLTGLLKGLSIEATVTAAVATGAFGVERADATGGIPPWPAVLQRMAEHAARRPVAPRLVAGLHFDETDRLWSG